MDRTAWERSTVERIGRAIKTHRRAAGLGQEELAERIGSTRNAIQNLESERARRSSVDLLDLMLIARELGVPPVELIFPDLPDGEVEAWPSHQTRSILAMQWFSGEITASDASDYLSNLSPEEQDRQRRGIEKVQRSRELEKYRSQLVGWGTMMAEYELEQAKAAGDEAAIALATGTLERAKSSDAEMQKFVVQLMAAMISRGMTVKPGEGNDAPYWEAWQLAQADKKAGSDGETTAPTGD